jgi:hypothetical protein
MVNPLTPELNLSAQHGLPRFLLGILIFKGLTAQRLYKSFGVKGLTFGSKWLHIIMCMSAASNIAALVLPV